MKQSEQLKLMIDCKTWFDEKFPEFRGLLHIVPMDPTIKKRCWLPGFRAICGQTRLMFVFHERVFFFYTKQTRGNISFFEINQLMVDHAAVFPITSLDDFVRQLRKILVNYQHQNLGL